MDGRPAGGLVAAGLAAGLAALIGIVVVALLIRPLEASTIDPDAAASVLYFDRIMEGHRLEAFVPTTPKPLLTLVYGLTWAGLHDWRALTWETLLVYGLAVALAGLWLARVAATRMTGRARRRIAAIAAATFVVTGLIAAPEIVLEVSRANSLVWALLFWLVAALAMTGPRPRQGLAGLALFLAGLARFETFSIVGGAALVLVTWSIAAAAGWARAPRGRTWLILLGALALPVACLHDLLLTGDPFFWASVPARYTELYVPGAEAIGPIEYARILAARYVQEWPLVVLAALGLALLVHWRQWVASLGLLALGGGTATLLFVLAARGTYISARYYEPVGLVLLALAAIGVSRLLVAVLGRGVTTSRRDGGWGPALAATAAGVIALVVAWPAAPFDPRVGRELDLVRTASVNLAAYIKTLTALAGGPTTKLPLPGPSGAPVANPRDVTLFVPSLLRPRIAVEAAAPLTLLGDTYASYVAEPSWVGLHAGQHLYHDRAADRPDALDEVLEADPARLADATAHPELIDPARGVRILVVVAPE